MDPSALRHRVLLDLLPFYLFYLLMWWPHSIEGLAVKLTPHSTLQYRSPWPHPQDPHPSLFSLVSGHRIGTRRVGRPASGVSLSRSLHSSPGAIFQALPLPPHPKWLWCRGMSPLHGGAGATRPLPPPSSNGLSAEHLVKSYSALREAQGHGCHWVFMVPSQSLPGLIPPVSREAEHKEAPCPWAGERV